MYKIFEHRKHPCIRCLGEAHIYLQKLNFFLRFFSVYSLCNATFFHSSYVIKPPHSSSAFYRQPVIFFKSSEFFVHLVIFAEKLVAALSQVYHKGD